MRACSVGRSLLWWLCAWCGCRASFSSPQSLTATFKALYVAVSSSPTRGARGSLSIVFQCAIALCGGRRVADMATAAKRKRRMWYTVVFVGNSPLLPRHCNAYIASTWVRDHGVALCARGGATAVGAHALCAVSRLCRVM